MQSAFLHLLFKGLQTNILTMVEQCDKIQINLTDCMVCKTEIT